MQKSMRVSQMQGSSTTEKLVDNFGRHVNYVRISVTDRCDFRCVYCMSEDMTFVPRAKILSLEELAQISRAFVELGVKKIRITGGEPLVRRDVVKLLGDIAALDGLQELTITTNGQPEQSYSERQIYEAALDRLARELAAVEGLDEDQANERLEKMLKAA